MELQEMINRIDEFIAQNSFLVSDTEIDEMLNLWNKCFDKANNMQENSNILEMKYENDRWGKWLLMKAEKNADGKNKYTDKTLEFELDILYSKDIEKFIKDKYMFKIIPNKLKVLEHKINRVKKIKWGN